jgi:hypothetical protein
MISYTKEAQLKHHNDRKAAKTYKSKGQEFEKQVQAEFQKGSVNKVRRNHQGKIGGGLGNPDIAARYGWHIETKNEERIRFRDYVKQVLEDCPKGHKPGIVLAVDKVSWLCIRLEDRKDFAASEVEASGGEVYFP